jgi:hypothetical protein
MSPEPGGAALTLITASDTSRAITHGLDPDRTRVSDFVPTHPGTADAARPRTWRPGR